MTITAQYIFKPTCFHIHNDYLVHVINKILTIHIYEFQLKKQTSVGWEVVEDHETEKSGWVKERERKCETVNIPLSPPDVTISSNIIKKWANTQTLTGF